MRPITIRNGRCFDEELHGKTVLNNTHQKKKKQKKGKYQLTHNKIIRIDFSHLNIQVSHDLQMDLNVLVFEIN